MNERTVLLHNIFAPTQLYCCIQISSQYPDSLTSHASLNNHMLFQGAMSLVYIITMKCTGEWPIKIPGETDSDSIETASSASDASLRTV